MRRPATGDRRPATGDRRPATGAVLISLLFLIGAALFLSACSSTADRSTHSSNGEVTGSDADAWKSDVLALSKSTDNSFVKAVAEDGVITKSEMDETFSRLTTCMEKRGYIGFEVVLSQDGLGYSYKVPSLGDDEQGGQDLTECEKSSGDLELTPLYGQIWRNPTNADVDELRLECLRRNEEADDSVTKAQVHSAYVDFEASGTVPFGGGDDVASCLENPAGVSPLTAPDAG